MAFFRKAVLASTMIAAGLASTTGAAFAQDEDNDGNDHSVVNAQGADTLNQLSACDINAQVLSILPLNDTEPNVGLDALNKQGDGNANSETPGADETCNPDSTSGSVDSADSGTSDVDAAGATRGEDD